MPPVYGCFLWRSRARSAHWKCIPMIICGGGMSVCTGKVARILPERKIYTDRDVEGIVSSCRPGASTVNVIDVYIKTYRILGIISRFCTAQVHYTMIIPDIGCTFIVCSCSNCILLVLLLRMHDQSHYARSNWQHAASKNYMWQLHNFLCMMLIDTQ